MCKCMVTDDADGGIKLRQRLLCPRASASRAEYLLIFPFPEGRRAHHARVGKAAGRGHARPDAERGVKLPTGTLRAVRYIMVYAS